MPRPYVAWRRIPVPTRSSVAHSPSTTFQDAVGKYLCSVGLSLLNSRYLRDGTRLSASNEQHVAALASALERVAEEVFAGQWDFEEPGQTRRRSHDRLDQDKLFDGLRDKAVWVLNRWDATKIEGRRRGGRHGAKDGVRKGKVPRWVPGLLADFDHLPPREMKAQALATLGCSESTYYDMLRKYRRRQELNRGAAGDAAAHYEALMKLLP